MIGKLARCAKSKEDSHACRNLHNAIKKCGKKLPVKITTVPLWIRHSRKRKIPVLTKHPVLLFSSWAKTIFDYGGHFFFGGKSLDHLDTYRVKLHHFWQHYQHIEPDLPFFKEVPPHEWGQSLPLAVHGDEGRGRAKQPVMVVSVQAILPSHDGLTNMSGHPFLAQQTL